MAGGLVLSACSSGDGNDGGDSPPESPSASAPATGDAALWRTEPVPIDSRDPGRRAFLWTPEDGPVVAVTRTGATAYDPASGAAEWTLRLPTLAGEPCGASQVNSDGIGAVMYDDRSRKGLRCTLLVVVDTRGGDVLWHEELDPTASSVVSEGTLVAVGERVVSARPHYRGPVHRFTLDGEPLPPMEVPQDDPAPCDEPTYWKMSPQFALAWTSCVQEDVIRLTAFRNDTGEPLWTSDLEGHGRSTLGELVPGEEVMTTVNGELVWFDDAGEPHTDLPAPGSGVVDGSVLVRADDSDDPGTDVIRGHDLRGGEVLWEEQFGVRVYELFDSVTGQGTKFDGGYREGEPLVLYQGEDDLDHIARLDSRNGSTTGEIAFPGDDPSKPGRQTETAALAARDSVVYRLTVVHELDGSAVQLSALEFPG